MDMRWHALEEFLSNGIVVAAYSAIFLIVGVYSLTKGGNVNHGMGLLLVAVGIVSLYDHLRGKEDAESEAAEPRSELSARR